MPMAARPPIFVNIGARAALLIIAGDRFDQKDVAIGAARSFGYAEEVVMVGHSRYVTLHHGSEPVLGVGGGTRWVTVERQRFYPSAQPRTPCRYGAHHPRSPRRAARAPMVSCIPLSNRPQKRSSLRLH